MRVFEGIHVSDAFLPTVYQLAPKQISLLSAHMTAQKYFVSVSFFLS